MKRHSCCSSHLLTFAYIEALELQKKFDDVKAVFDAFLELHKADLAATEERIKSSSSTSSIKTEDDATEQSSARDDKATIKDDELEDKKNEYGLVYIMYLRFVRRTENVAAARAIFKRARFDKWVTWHVYEASGL